jgi:hypothetical protein
LLYWTERRAAVMRKDGDFKPDAALAESGLKAVILSLSTDDEARLTAELTRRMK